MIPSPVIVFAVHYPCLFLVQFQTITLELKCYNKVVTEVANKI